MQVFTPRYELDRIQSIPSRDFESEDYLEETNNLIIKWTDKLRTKGDWVLRADQARALEDLANYGSILAPIPVGGGKTLLSYLAPTVCRSKSPMLLVPANLLIKTQKDFQKLSTQWVNPPPIAVVSYNRISRKNGREYLENLIKPDLIICDEAHKLKNKEASCTRKIIDYFEKFPNTKFCGMTGTFLNRSISELEHLLFWAFLGRQNDFPLPLKKKHRLEWGQAIDEKVQNRYGFGSLIELLEPEEENTLESVRKAVRRRIIQTPGVIASKSSELSDLPPLVINQCLEDFSKKDQAINKAITQLLAAWTLPSGETLITPMEVYYQLKALSLGFYYKWKFPAPEEWRQARGNWGYAVRQILGNNAITQADSEEEIRIKVQEDSDFANRVIRFASGNTEKLGDILEDWLKIRDSFKPIPQSVFISQVVAKWVLDWTKKNKNSLIWVAHKPIGVLLNHLYGWPLFVEEGLDKKGRYIEEWEPTSCAIASIKANSQGRNLQHFYSKNLVIGCPPQGAVWEQLLGRTHRPGQEADEVICDILISGDVDKSDFWQARKDAKYIESGYQTQKLNYADIL